MKNSKTFILVALLAFVVGCSENDEMPPSNTSPAIADQSFSIEEQAPEGTSLGTVIASDADGDSLSFSITNGNDDETFQINSLSGELTLSGILNYGLTSSYILSVQVSDGEEIATASMTVNVLTEEATIRIPGFPGNSLFNGQLVDADYWSDQPEILSAGMGFADISGIEVDVLTEETN